MLLFGVRNRATGEDVEFRSNPVNLFPTKEEAQEALDRVNEKAKEADKIDGEVITFTRHEPVIARARPR